MNMPTLTLVMDTNVYISAALRGELAERILQLAAAGRIRVITSTVIMEELAEKMRERFGWSASQVKTLLEILESITEIITPNVSLSVITEDQDDNRILECAVAGHADLIISFDNDLLRLRQYEGIGIIRPEELFYYDVGEKSPRRRKKR
jgi:putative PIN family toxin of toxin-antitoxin system